MTEKCLCDTPLGIQIVFGSIALLAVLLLLFLFVGLILEVGFGISLIDLSIEHGGLYNLIKNKLKGE